MRIKGKKVRLCHPACWIIMLSKCWRTIVMLVTTVIGTLLATALPPVCGVWQGDQRTLKSPSPTAATFSTSKAARALAVLGRSAGTSASACCLPGSSCSSVSSRA